MTDPTPEIVYLSVEEHWEQQDWLDAVIADLRLQGVRARRGDE